MVKVLLTSSIDPRGPSCRLAFAQGIFEKCSINGSTARFQCKGILSADHPDIKKIEEAEELAAKEKWGAKADAMLKMIRKADDGVLHDGDMKPNWDGFEGNFYVNCASDNRPGIYDRDRTPLAQSDGRPYGGCFVNLRIDVWAQDNGYGKKLNASLLGIQFVRDGDSFAAGAPPADADDFPELAVDGAAADPLLD